MMPYQPGNLWIGWQTIWVLVRFLLLVPLVFLPILSPIVLAQWRRHHWLKLSYPASPVTCLKPGSQLQILKTESWFLESELSGLLALLRYRQAQPLFVLVGADCPSDRVRPTIDRAGHYYIKDCPEWADSSRHEVLGFWINPARALRYADQLLA